MADQWPAPTPRDDVYARVLTRGHKLRLIRRLLIGAAALGAGAAAVTGYAVGASERVDVFGAGTVDAPLAAAPLHACPGGEPIADLHRGDRVYLTGRDDVGAWVEVRSPYAAGDRMWMQSAHVAPDADLDSLPVQSCGTSEFALTLADGTEVVVTTTTTIPGEETTTTTAPGETTTTAGGDPTPPGPTPPTGPATTTTTAPPADATGPNVTDLQRTNSALSDNDGYEFCSVYVFLTEVSAQVADPSGIQSVRVEWSFTGNGQPRTGSKAMTFSNGRWRATLGQDTDPVVLARFPNGTMANGVATDIGWKVRATDAKGNQRVVASSPNSAVELHGC